jgi:hypothetical protein
VRRSQVRYSTSLAISRSEAAVMVLGDGIDYVNHFDAFPLHVAMNGEDAERRDQFKSSNRREWPVPS